MDWLFPILIHDDNLPAEAILAHAQCFRGKGACCDVCLEENTAEDENDGETESVGCGASLHSYATALQRYIILISVLFG